jgi:hypothetical protein
MGFEYQVRMICDRCGSEIEPWLQVKSLESINIARWKWQTKHVPSGVMIGLPNHCAKYFIYCQPCADGATVAGPKKISADDDSQAKKSMETD